VSYVARTTTAITVRDTGRDACERRHLNEKKHGRRTARPVSAPKSNKRGGCREPPLFGVAPLRLAAGVFVDVDALLAKLGCHRLRIGLDVLLDSDPLLGDGLLLDDRLLLAERHLELVITDLLVADAPPPLNRLAT